MSCPAWTYESYSDAYASDTVTSGGVARAGLAMEKANSDVSITIGHRYSQLFQWIVDARSAAETDNWDGDGAPAIDARVVDAAIILSNALPQSLPLPQVQAEPTGEITFEWYKDRTHVAVLAVDCANVRWSAIAGTDAPRSGAAPFMKTLPSAALAVIREVLS